MHHFRSKNCQAERIAFSERSKIHDRFKGFVRTCAAAELGHHAAGHIQNELDVREHALVLGFAKSLWPG
jgi:hypothetical protein